MNQLNKKMVIGTIAASMLLGGGIVAALHANSAYADDSATTQTPTTGQTDASGKAAPGLQGKRGGDFGKGGHGEFGMGRPGDFGKGGPGDFGKGGPGFRGGSEIQEAATLLGIDAQTLMSELQQNKTLAQVAQEKKGWTEDVLIQKLTEVETKAIDDAVTAGKMTKEQADQAKAGLADRLKHEVTATGAGGDHGRGKGPRGGFGGFGPFGKPDAVTQILGVTQDELKAAQDAGKSLADIAQEKGISEDQLIGKLKDGMTDQLKQFVERKRPAKPAPAATTK